MYPADLSSQRGEPTEPRELQLDHGAIIADPAMVATYELLRRLARSELSVLIVGETGSGKEKAARSLHGASHRARGPFVAVNCAAIPDTLIESELFGHERGSFSGAERAKAGLIECAAGGTLFLDEICELPLLAQAKLLRVLQERTVLRVGATAPVPVDFRLVAATNRDVATDMSAGRFRQDLYFRIAAAVVRLPPLRCRPLDVPVLARVFLGRACARHGRACMAISPDVMHALCRYPFPGNVRELENAMEYAAATWPESTLELAGLPSAISGDIDRSCSPQSIEENRHAPSTPRFRPIAEEIEMLERRRMLEALEAARGNQRRAAELIAMPRRTFVAKLRRYGLRANS